MPDYSAAPTTPGPWSPAQLIRLEGEWRRLQRAFAYHPAVQIIPLAGDPPGEYQIQYKVTTLAIDEAGQLAYVTSCPIHLWLPPQFPHAPPVVRPMAAVFHPNVTMDWVYLDPPWNPSMTLAGLVTQIGQLLAFQAYDPEAVANSVAMDWVHVNMHLLPTDPTVNFSPDSGGDPLGRIMRFGAGTLEQLRKQITGMFDKLLSPTGAPPSAEVQQFSEQTRLAISLFSEADVPDPLRTVANELDEAALSMQGGAKAAWDGLGRQFTTAHAAATARDEAVRAEGAMTKAVKALEAASGAAPDADGDAIKTLSRVPSPNAVQPLALNLRKTIREAEQRIAALRSRLASLAGEAPVLDTVSGNLLADRLEREAARASQAVYAARDTGAAALGSIERALQEAKRESAAADRVVEWGEYADLMRRAGELVQKISGLGPAGVQAYFTQSAAGRYGPFDYEQGLDLSGAMVAVSNPSAAAIEVIDPTTGDVIAGGDGAGDVNVTLRGEGGEPFVTAIRRTERTDELRVQLEYLVTRTREYLVKLGGRAGGELTASWAGRFDAALGSVEALELLGEAHRRNSHLWKALLADLIALGRFKQRLATYHLLERTAEFIPRVQQKLADTRAALKQAQARLGEIAARSSRDIETDRLIVPHKLIEEYNEKLRERDKANRDIPRLQKSMQTAAARVKVRLSSARRYGAPGVPRFRALPAAPPGLAEFGGVLSDASVVQQIEGLEALLGATLRDPGSPALQPAALEPQPEEAQAETPEAGAEAPGTGDDAPEPVESDADAPQAEADSSAFEVHGDEEAGDAAAGDAADGDCVFDHDDAEHRE